MEFNRDNFAASYKLEELPYWKCPSCKRGTLVVSSKSVDKCETNSSKSGRSHDVDRSLTKSFKAELNCNNQQCKEAVYFAGYIKTQYEWVSSLHQRKDVEYYYPEYFFPYIKLFPLPEYVEFYFDDCYENVCKLFWIDKSACINAIRKFVEEILTERGIVKTERIQGKRKGLSLHKRLQIYHKKDAKVANILLAIKWIGNEGSHKSEVEEETLLEVIEILQHALNCLYSDKEARIMRKVKQINRNKPELK